VIFAVSVAPVFWTYPNNIGVPPLGNGVFTLSYWLGSLTVVLIFPFLLESSLDVEGTFLIFAVITYVMAFLLIFLMKENFGKSKDQIELMFCPESDIEGKDKAKTEYKLELKEADKNEILIT